MLSPPRESPVLMDGAFGLSSRFLGRTITMITTPCPLAHCDPAQCGWRASDISCEWQDQAIDTTGTEDDCDD